MDWKRLIAQINGWESTKRGLSPGIVDKANMLIKWWDLSTKELVSKMIQSLLKNWNQ